MLLTKDVEVTLSNAIIKQYEEKGYYIPRYVDTQGRKRVKRGTIILVKATDLSKGSNIKVKCNCDTCGKIYPMTYRHYVNENHDGKTYCRDCFAKVLLSGKNHWNWKYEKTQEERELGRAYPEYSDFIKRVLSRDNYTCQCCGQYSGNLEVHHLDGYDWCVDKRTEDINGITLCERCHKNFHAIYGNGGNTKEQFEEWFGNTIELLEYKEELLTAKLIICLETKEIGTINYFVKKYNIKDSRIYRCCNKKEKTADGKHYLWYEKYINMSEYDLDVYLKWSLHNNCKQVICLNTLEVFNKMTDAVEKYSLNRTLLARCCQGNGNYAGIHPETGEKLKWMYYEEYLNITNVA